MILLAFDAHSFHAEGLNAPHALDSLEMMQFGPFTCVRALEALESWSIR